MSGVVTARALTVEECEARGAFEANVGLVDLPDGWHVKIAFDDGAFYVTEFACATRELAQRAVDEWIDESGIRFVRAQ